MSHFVICTNSKIGGSAGASVLERNAITDYLKFKGWPVWHWFEDVWFTVDASETTATGTLRDELRAIIDDRTHILVLKVHPLAHSGFGPKAGWPWMNENNWGNGE
jgi:hypothetical protein